MVLLLSVFQKFGEYYDLIYSEFPDYKAECDFIEKVAEKFFEEKPRRILDLGCGTGSHALILAKRGYQVTGIDQSDVVIQRAKEKAREEKIKAHFFVQDMREFKLQGKFDCAICMFGGFGYLLTYSDLERLFFNLAHHLNENGVFMFECWSVGGLKPTPYRSWLKRQDKNVTLYRMSESNFDNETNILDIDMDFVVTDDKTVVDIFDEKHQIRCYTIAEMQHYVNKNEYELLAVYNWDTENKTELKEPKKDTFRIMAIVKPL